MQKAREIGSDFWKTELKKTDTRFFLAGRTALEYIIRDILVEKTIKSVLMPSYCCYTMIEPFKRHCIQIRFYDVLFQDGKLTVDIPEAKDNEIFFAIKYFGYCELADFDMGRIGREWECIIEDCTHSWLIDERQQGTPDYRFISYRKWTGIGAISTAEKLNGKFNIAQQPIINEIYNRKRTTAEEGKKVFIEENKGDKNKYLNAFGEAERGLSDDYVDYLPSYESIYRFFNMDVDEIKRRRRENATVLLDGVKGISGITLMFDTIEKTDTPLFVPILIQPERRDALRNYLIYHQIYCPVHWPLSDLHAGISERAIKIYNQELSLVCDQRYDCDDMERIIKTIRNYF